MNKKQYIQPVCNTMTVLASHPITASNEVENGGINTNPGSMEEGDGGDAAKGRYNEWGNLW